MAVLALVLIGLWLAIIAGLQALIHVRRTGNTQLVRYQDRPGSAQWWARVVSTVALTCAVAAPIAELLGWGAVAFLDRTPVRVTGAAVVVVGIAAVFGAQLAMGDSWRADVDPEVRTRLVTTGPFRFVRNPVFTANSATFVGLALLVPHPLSLIMLVAAFAAMEIQVRLVEEPYLHQVHGAAWAQYAARTGRFLPFLGRLRPQ